MIDHGAHAYQGAKNVPKVILVGSAFTLLYLLAVRHTRSHAASLLAAADLVVDSLEELSPQTIADLIRRR